MSAAPRASRPRGAEDDPDGATAPRQRFRWLAPRSSLRDLVETRERAHAPLFGGGAPPPEPELRGRRAAGGFGFVDEPGPGEAGVAPGSAPAADTRGWAGRFRPRPRRLRRARAERTEQGSLFGEILDWMFAPLLLLWPLSVAVTFVVARSLADAPFDRALVERTETLAQQVLRLAADRIVVDVPSPARDFLAADDEDAVYYQVIGPRGRVVAGEPDMPRPGIYDFPASGKVKLRTTSFRSEQVRIGYLYLGLGDDELGPVLVQVAETLDRRGRLANEIIKGVIFPQFLILPIAVVLVWFGLSRGLAPLESLQQRIRDRSPDDLSPIDAKAAPEEIAPLVDAFNDLLERLSENVSAQQRFIADAAHQLKTPLAGLRTQ
ncbi:MAG TPA: sensor histidine kinase N-terminal domain-containing protein, partial [Burkholderiaceae bacterium]|nr:sensor histidine kinase N-terminal domain-containing protein [Burkholderiaceae bacterium]